MQETQLPSLGWEVSLEEGLATHTSFLAWRIPCTEESGGLQSTGSQRVGNDWVTNMHMYYNSNPWVKSRCSGEKRITNDRAFGLLQRLHVLGVETGGAMRSNFSIKNQRFYRSWINRVHWWCWSVAKLYLTLFQPHGPTRLLCPWNFPGRNTGVGYHFLLQGIFPT